MGLDEIKRWHWVLIAVVIGGLIAFARVSVLPDEEMDALPTIAPDRFVADLSKTVTRNGKPSPTVHRIVVYPQVEGKHFVTGQRWDAISDRPDHAQARAFCFHAPVPFIPPGQNQPPRADYTIVDHLEEAKAQHEHLSYRYAWWREPAKAYALWIALSVVVIGGIWPTVINLLIGAGLARPREPKCDYDLSRFRSEAPADEKKRRGITDEQLQRLRAMEAQLEANLKPSGLGHAIAGHDQPLPAPVRRLDTAPVDPAPVQQQDEQPKEYAGEFYPVARSHGKHDQ